MIHSHHLLSFLFFPPVLLLCPSSIYPVAEFITTNTSFFSLALFLCHKLRAKCFCQILGKHFYPYFGLSLALKRCLLSFFLSFYQILLFRAVLGHRKIAQKVQRVPIYLFSLTPFPHTVLPINIFHQCGRNHTVCTFSRPASFTQQCVWKVPSCVFVT